MSSENLRFALLRPLAGGSAEKRAPNTNPNRNPPSSNTKVSNHCRRGAARRLRSHLGGLAPWSCENGPALVGRLCLRGASAARKKGSWCAFWPGRQVFAWFWAGRVRRGGQRCAQGRCGKRRRDFPTPQQQPTQRQRLASASAGVPEKSVREAVGAVRREGLKRFCTLPLAHGRPVRRPIPAMAVGFGAKVLQVRHPRRVNYFTPVLRRAQS